MAILDLIFPKKCLECKTSGKYICADCLKKVPPGGWTNRETYSCFKYEGVIRKAIIALKYKYTVELVGELAGCVLGVLERSSLFIIHNSCLVPIPLHWYRKNVRGFNQSEEVGKIVARKMKWKFAPDLLIRSKSTTPQAQLTGSARRKNLRGAFALNPVYSLYALRYPLVLFDDVLTTGSTLLEASKVLRKSGIEKIFCLTIAK